MRSPVDGVTLRFQTPLSLSNKISIRRLLAAILFEDDHIRAHMEAVMRGVPALKKEIVSLNSMTKLDGTLTRAKRFDALNMPNYLGCEVTRQLLKHYHDALAWKKENKIPACYGSDRISDTGFRHMMKAIMSMSNHNLRKLKRNTRGDQTYGEVKLKSLLQIIRAFNMNGSSLYLDLGSGIGQTVLAVSALTNCRMARGIEMNEQSLETCGVSDVSFLEIC